MDATRAELEFTAEVCAIAVAEGATVVNIPDTVGYTTPEEYRRYFEGLYELAPELSEVRLSVHCHDDLGLAVANSFAGLLAGARQVECAVNGIGERAGNCSLEEIVMLLRTRRDEHGLDTELDTRELARTSRMVSRFTGYAVQPNKAIVGAKRVRARVRHPPGRRAEGAHDLRDHGRARRRPGVELDRARQALRAATRFATRSSSSASRSRATRSTRRSSASRRSPTARSTSPAWTSRRSSPTRSARARSATSSPGSTSRRRRDASRGRRWR